MSGRSGASGSVRSCGSLRLGPGTAHEVVLDALYERKRDKKTVRVLTVIIYVFCVSLAAIMLSLYYVFFWEPKDAQYAQRKVFHSVEQQTSTTPMPTCFMPLTGGGDTAVNDSITHTPPDNITTGFINANMSDFTTDPTEEPTALTDTPLSPQGLLNETSDDIGLFNETDSIT